MTNYQELKRLARAVAAFTAKVSVSQYPSMQHQKIVAEQEFHAAASPDVVLGLIKSLEHTTMAAETEAKEVDERNAVIDRLRLHIKHIGNDALRTQNQALREALEDATDEIESWGAYASEYFQEKHDLAGNVAKFRAITQAEGGV